MIKWKMSLFGYRESEVNEYLNDLSRDWDEECASYRDKIDAARTTSLRLEPVLADLREEVSLRRSRLEKVERGLIHAYYQAIQGQIKDKPAVKKYSDQGGGKDYPRWESRRMKNQRILNTSLLGVAPGELERYLIEQEKKHDTLISDLAEKLGRLEDTIVAQKEEIKGLEEQLKKPEMQKQFIDLAERFLARFEQILERTLREPTYKKSRTPSDFAGKGDVLTVTDRAGGGPDHNDSLRLLYLMDKIAGRDLIGRGGKTLIRKGEPIRLETAEMIDQQGLIDQLVENLS